MKEFDIQRFADSAEAGTTVAADLEPAISIDLIASLTDNIRTLNSIISVNQTQPMPAGTTIKMYETKIKSRPKAQVAEGVNIPLTEVERVLKNTFELTLNKERKNTTAEAIQKIGRTAAINDTDRAVVKAIQKDIKANFFSFLATGTGKATAKAPGLQAACSAAWAAVQKFYEDVDATPIYFISTDDAADYLGAAQITMQTSFGMSYVENFLGLGTAFISPSVPAGNVLATAKENLHLAYIPANSSDLAQTFGLTSDSTGFVGMTHSALTGNATVDTLLMWGILFFPEDLDGIIKVPVQAAAADAGKTTADSGSATTPAAGK